MRYRSSKLHYSCNICRRTNRDLDQDIDDLSRFDNHGPFRMHTSPLPLGHLAVSIFTVCDISPTTIFARTLSINDFAFVRITPNVFLTSYWQQKAVWLNFAPPAFITQSLVRPLVHILTMTSFFSQVT